MFGTEDIDVTGKGYEHVTQRRCLGHWHHSETIHRSFNGFNRVSLGHDHIGAESFHAHRQSSAAPTIPGDYDNRSGQQEFVARRIPSIVD
jgi:hypothetical protein